MTRVSKKERHKKLMHALNGDPFLTDGDLANRCNVSIQTIRLDRMELGIPELRERIKHMAEEKFDSVRSLAPEEVYGEVIDLQLDHSGTSIIEIMEDHVFERNQIARGHYLFAQANSLAVAIVNSDLALTKSADIRFIRPVKLGEKCLAHAHVVAKKGQHIQINIETKVMDETVFHGVFDVYCLEEDVLSK
ncbi:transcription factor FapR [Hazenella sp. IB182353]|nr:transcription factor FapR [Polycladospora coralii]